MATLTIRKIPDEQIQQLKQIAEEHNRSMEAEARSILEDWLAKTVAHRSAQKTNFALALRQFMEDEGIEGLAEGEFPLPERTIGNERPPIEFE